MQIVALSFIRMEFPVSAAEVSPSSDSVGTLYRAHQGWLHGWLRKKLGCSHHAADLVQDTFVRVLTRDHGLAMREPRAYLTTIANGLLIDHWRKQDIERAWMESMSSRPEAVAPSPEQRLLVLDTLYRIDRMLASLPERVRQAFLLAQIHGLTYVRIAERLQVSERMIKKYMAQAMLACIALDEAS